MPPNLSTVTISSTSPALAVTALLDESTPTPSGGVGGWEQVTRPKRTALTEWGGHDVYAQSIGLMLDGFADDTSVEIAVANLRRLARALPGEKHPAIVKVAGPLFGTDLEWVINGLSFGALERSWSSGAIIRQRVVVDLLQYVMPPLKVTKAVAVGGAKPTVKTRAVTVKKTDTLGSIAARELKNAKRYKEIIACNPGRGLAGNQIPKALIGKTLRVPVR